MDLYKRRPELGIKRREIADSLVQKRTEFRELIAREIGARVLETPLREKILHPKRYFGLLRSLKRGVKSFDAMGIVAMGKQKHGDDFIDRFEPPQPTGETLDESSVAGEGAAQLSLTEPELVPEPQHDQLQLPLSPQSSDLLPPQFVSDQS